MNWATCQLPKKQKRKENMWLPQGVNGHMIKPFGQITVIHSTSDSWLLANKVKWHSSDLLPLLCSLEHSGALKSCSNQWHQYVLQQWGDKGVEESLMRGFLSEHLSMRHLLVSHCFGLNQLILMCMDKRPDPFVHVFPWLFNVIYCIISMYMCSLVVAEMWWYLHSSSIRKIVACSILLPLYPVLLESCWNWWMKVHSYKPFTTKCINDCSDWSSSSQIMTNFWIIIF